MEENMLNVSSSPHVRAKDSTNKIMLYVIIALLPTTIYGIVNFGLPAAILVIVSIASCVASEVVFDLIAKKPLTIKDLSAVVTGLLLALNLPSTLPWWMAVLGGVFAIIVVKMLFGGLGQNFMNPALGARCFLLIAFAADMTKFTTETYTSATPLAAMRAGEMPYSNMDLLIGRTPGTIGETSAIAILIGAIILILLGVITLEIPGTYILSFLLFMIVFSQGGLIQTGSVNVGYMCAQLCSGGLMLGAFFMATDYVTSPITPKGRILFGCCCGILTGLFRCFGANAEGVSFAIIISNLLVPLMEKCTIPRAFGQKKKKKEAK